MSTTTLPRILARAVADSKLPLDGSVATLLSIWDPAEPIRLVVDEVFETFDQALGSIDYDGVNPLPSAILDLNSPVSLTALNYDPVQGLSVGERLELTDQIGDQDIAEMFDQGL